MFKKYFNPTYIFIFGLSVTLIVSLFIFKQIEQKFQNSNFLKMQRVKDDLQNAISIYTHPLQGNAAFYSVYDYDVDPKLFEKYAYARDNFKNFKGALGFGFIRYVKKDEVKKYLLKQQKYRPGFAFRRLNGESNTEQDLYVIETVEPYNVNAKAVGLVVSDEKFRRDAAYESMRTGRPVLTKAIELVQSNRRGLGMLLFYPVYKTNTILTTEAERIQNIVGWSYAPILNAEVANYVLSRNTDAPSFKLIENGTLKNELNIFKNTKQEKEYDQILSVSVFGTNWFLKWDNDLYPVNNYEWIIPLFIFLAFCTIFILFYFYIEKSKKEKKLILKKDIELKDKIEQIKAEIDRNEIFLRKIVNNIPSLIGYWDKHLINQFSNVEYIKYFGKSTEEIKGIHFSKLIPPEVFAANLPFVEKALAGETQEFERVLTKTDGKKVVTNAKYIPDVVNGEVEGFFVVVSDITNYVESEELIRLLHQAVNHSPVEIEIVNKDEIVEYVNERFTQTTGFSRDLIVGKKSPFFTNKNFKKEDILEIKKQVLIEEYWHGEVLSNKKNGEEFLEDVNISSVNNEKGELTHYLLIKKDVTKLKENESKLAFNSKLASIGEMAADVAHEINNPLAIISLHVDNLQKKSKRDALKNEDLSKAIVKINDNIKRISSVVTSLGFYSKDTGVEKFNKARVDSLVQRAKDLCSEKIKFSGVDFYISPYEDFLIECNDVQIQQVLFNLLNNAFETLEGKNNSWVRLEIFKDQENAYFRVSDSGKINYEISEFIFQPFYSTKKEKKKVGLGLTISLNIAKEHFGNLELISNLENTTFQLTIPLRQAVTIKQIA